MKKKILSYINENEMIKYGDRVLVALSGGPDSICLLHILNSLKEELNITLTAAHVNHCLRGSEADEDEEYVKDFCNKLNIPCYVKKANINQIASERKISSELAGREVRYEFFEEISKIQNLNKIAVAHNTNDQAETLLMRIMRGTGIEGLVGIRPIRDNKFIRPILCLERNEIENYCEKYNLNPRIDKTNLENIYSRNKVRLEMIPYIKGHFNEEIVNSLNRLSQLAYIENDYMEQCIEKEYKTFCNVKNNTVFILKKAFQSHNAIKFRLLRKVFLTITGSSYNLEMKHIEDIISLQLGETGKVICLPNKIKAKNIYGNIELIKEGESYNKKDLDEVFIDKYSLLKDENKFNLHDNIGYDLSIKFINNKDIQFNNNSLIKYFDYDKIKEGILIRKRKNGDKILPLGMKGYKKIKNIFIDNKIPKELRNQIPIICFDNEISWILGVKVSEIFKVTKDSKNILKISFIERK